MKLRLPIAVHGAIGAALFTAAAHFLTAVMADQSERVPPTSGIYTGVQFSQAIGNAVRSISSANKGPTAPANVGGSAVDGLDWIDDSTTPWTWKRFVNGGWAVQGYFDPATSSFVGIIGGGIATISAGATVDLGSVPQANVTVSGAATIASFGASAQAGVEKTIRFDNVSTLSPSNALLVPGGFPLQTAAGDRATVTHLGSGNWEVTAYTRASGIPVDVAAVGKLEFKMTAAVPALSLTADGSAISRATYPAYLAAVTRAQNGTRTSGNATITGIADTSLFGGGMPVESTGVNAGCTVASFVANTSITLNSSSCVTASGTSPVTVFLTGYGSGGSSSTVGLPNCQGRMPVGVDPTGSVMTSSYFGAGAGAINTQAGSDHHALVVGEIPSISSSGPASTSAANGSVVPITTGNITDVTLAYAGGSSNPGPFPQRLGGGVWNGQATFSGTANVTSSGTLGNAHAIVPPVLTSRCLVRVTA